MFGNDWVPMTQGVFYNNLQRKSFTTLKIRLLRQAAILLEFLEFSEKIQNFLKVKTAIKYVWKNL